MSTSLRDRFPNYDQFVQYFMVVVVIVLVSLLFPNNVKFKYEFKLGETWRYEDLEAPFDIPIKKSQEEIEADRERITQNSFPFYRLNPDLAAAKTKDAEAEIERWIEAYNTQLDSLAKPLEKEKFSKFGGQILQNIFAQGVIKLAAEHQGKDGNMVLSVVQGNTTFKRTLSSFLTVESAKEAVRNALDDSGLTWPVPLREILLGYVVPDLNYDAELTEKVRADALAGLVTTKGMIEQGDLIVQQGDLITSEVYQNLVSLRETYHSDVGSQRSEWTVYLGYLLITTLLMVAFMLFLNAHRKDVLLNWRYLAFLLVFILVFSGLTFLLEGSNALNAYIVPFCIVPILVSHFFSMRLAFFTHVMVVLIAGFLTQLGFEFVFIQIIAGVVAVLAVADARDWSKFFRYVLTIMLAYGLAYLGVSIIEEGSFLKMDWDAYGLLAFNGLLTLLAFPLIPLVERVFGFTSSISLVELSDMNRPLLRDLAIKAPGTLQHSLQVGNLCEAAASKIGADALLVKVGALYHDIGKMNRPDFFVENQGLTSPHNKLDPIESAEIIIGHVSDGIEMAKKNRLPKVIIRFIETHHGTTRADFFYKKYLQQNPGVTVDESKFTYAGPKPSSKEEAIMMLADTIEAASRSLKSPTKDDIEELVEKLTGAKVKAGQLNESALSLGELATCKAVFKKMLNSIHHVRIEYPE